MGLSKQAFQEAQQPGPVAGTFEAQTWARTYRGFSTIKDELRRMLDVLRSDIIDQPGATCAVSGDYTPATNEILDQIELIMQKIKRL